MADVANQDLLLAVFVQADAIQLTLVVVVADLLATTIMYSALLAPRWERKKRKRQSIVSRSELIKNINLHSIKNHNHSY